MEGEEGVEDIDAEGVEAILKFLEYIPLCKGKVKASKDLDAEKFSIHTPLLPKNITFEGPCLARVPILKMEDWDFADNERFPHLMMENYMKWVYYK